ncbi:MAG: PaaI family thioesterase [Prevotella sp.]|nr:PaaI family thioesterase [Prevotella sp.]
MRKIINPWTNKDGYQCFGCCPNNPIGVHMEFFEDNDDIVCFWKPQPFYQGWIDTMHGGILCTLMDETAAWVVFRKLQTCGVTSHLEVKFKKPIMTTETQITIRAHIVEQRRNIVTIDVTIENAKGELCNTAQATYFAFDKQKALSMGFTSCDVERDPYLPM